MALRENYALPKENLLLLGVGFVVILIGCICMIGGGSTDGVSYNPEIFSPMRITVAPIILVIGFFFEIVAIVWLRGGKDKNNDETEMEKGLSTYDDSRRIDLDNVADRKVELPENEKKFALEGSKKQRRR
ncbi:MAG: DUF3098 domain-containing protein [Paludibacteraceae bacterium]|nr:DUF3098 domain-containing protein [Paludibacteraceae bacterium]